MTHGEADPEVLENHCREDEEFRPGQSLSHAYPLPHPVGHEPLPVLPIQEPVGVEGLRLFPVFGVEVDCKDVVKEHAVLGDLVPVQVAIFVRTVGQGGGTHATESLNFHDGGVTVGQDGSIGKGRSSTT